MSLFRRFWCYAAGKVRPFFDIDMNGKKISGLPNPTVDSEAARKKYVDDKIDGDMLKSTYDINENDIVDNAEKLEGSTKAEVRDHVVKEHTLNSHSAPTNDVTMAGRKITHIGEPTQDQDIVTKKYVDDLLEQVTPADIPIFPWPWTPGSSEATIRSQYSTLLSLGINAFLSQHHIDDYKNNPAAADWYDRVYNLAEEYGIKIFWYTGLHYLDYKNPVTESHPVAKYFVERYGAFPACGGWFMVDEPSAHYPDYPWAGLRERYLQLKSQDPSSHPTFHVWVVSVYDNWRDRYYYTCHPSHSQTWCMIEDVCSIDCYPWGNLGISGLTTKVTGDYSNPAPYNDGPGDCPKKMIPCMQAWFPEGVVPKMPDDGIVQQYNVWKATYGYSGLEAIGLYQAHQSLFAAGDDAENIRNQIKALARLRGWGG